MIIFRFRVTFTGCIEVCNEGIKCFIAALLLLLAIHDRLSKRIGIGIVLLEYYGTGTFFDGIVCLNIMHGVHHTRTAECAQTSTRTTKAVSDSDRFLLVPTQNYLVSPPV